MIDAGDQSNSHSTIGFVAWLYSLESEPPSNAGKVLIKWTPRTLARKG